MESSDCSDQTHNYDKLKIENEKLIEEISMLKKEIYDLKNLHVYLTINEETKQDECLEEDYENEFEIRDDMSPYERFTATKEHLEQLWENRTKEPDWPFTIEKESNYLEITRRKEALKLYENKPEEEEIRVIEIDEDVYVTNGIFVLEINEEGELGEILGYIESNDENNPEQVIFFN